MLGLRGVPVEPGARRRALCSSEGEGDDRHEQRAPQRGAPCRKMKGRVPEARVPSFSSIRVPCRRFSHARGPCPSPCPSATWPGR
jgi:hypothetical protein